jgi:hypothetical protein
MLAQRGAAGDAERPAGSTQAEDWRPYLARRHGVCRHDLPRLVRECPSPVRFPAYAAFPKWEEGWHPHCHFRGLLRLHTRYGPPDRSAALMRPLSRGSGPSGYRWAHGEATSWSTANGDPWQCLRPSVSRLHPNIGSRRILDRLQAPCAGLARGDRTSGMIRYPLFPHRPPGACDEVGAFEPFLRTLGEVRVLPVSVPATGWADDPGDVARLART